MNYLGGKRHCNKLYRETNYNYYLRDYLCLYKWFNKSTALETTNKQIGYWHLKVKLCELSR